MKNVLISLFALAAISGTAFASDYGNGNGGNGSYIRKPATTTSSGLIVVKKKKLTAFERMILNSQDSDHGDSRSNHDGQN